MNKPPPPQGWARVGAVIAGWAGLWVVLGLYSVPAAVIGPQIDHGSYCESDDHPGSCPDLLPALLYSLTAIAGGSCAAVAGLQLRRGQPGAPSRSAGVLTVWAVGMLALGVWAAREDTGTRLSAPGRALLVTAVINAAACTLFTLLVLRTAHGERHQITA